MSLAPYIAPGPPSCVVDTAAALVHPGVVRAVHAIGLCRKSPKTGKLRLASG